jgi:hypothetical protein
MRMSPYLLTFEDPLECPPRTLPGPAGGRRAAEFCNASVSMYSSTEGPTPCHAIILTRCIRWAPWPVLLLSGEAPPDFSSQGTWYRMKLLHGRQRETEGDRSPMPPRMKRR